MPTLPTGTVTFLFTDIQGSTHLLQRLGDVRYAQALAEHRQLLRADFQDGGGHEIETQGDGFLVAFQSARGAVLTAIAAQRAINAHPWPDGAALTVRMGLHTAETLGEGGAYVGLGVHRAARICSAAWGGQVLLSQTTSDVIENDLPGGARLRDLGEYHLKDLQRPERIFQLLHSDLHADFPPLRALDVLPNNLPRQLTSFIGREREMAEVKRLLTTTRLLTLTGSGGCGKTRLALQVAAELLEEFKGGVWLVELATISDQTLVPQRTASALGVREQSGYRLIDTLVDFLGHKSLLLLLDNCEHLLPACAELADALLHGCPDLRILATSREAMGIAGETRWRVPSLSLPDIRHPPSLERLKQCEAVRLFIERAMASSPTFTLTDQDAPVLVQVVTRLDGIPLAIELAAARVRVLAVEQIAERLDDRFHLLTGGSRTALPRHQTLLSTMEWSHDLLFENERMLFRRLAVFAGSFTLEAAEALCAGEGVDESGVLNLLTRLVDKSLVVVEDADGEVRYRLLETVRQYGQERLKESGETASVRGRHVDFFLALAERAEPELRGLEQALWLERLEAEHDNLRAALEWSVDSGTDEGLRLAGALFWFWSVRGYYREGRSWLGQVLRRSGSAPSVSRAKALAGAGYLATNQGDYPAALTLLDASLAIRRELGDKQGIAISLNWLGRVAWHQGDFQRASALYNESLVLSRESGATDNIGVLLNNLGVLAITQGAYVAAQALLEESLAIRRQLGDKQGIAMTAANLGGIAFRQGRYEAARSLFEESLAIDRDLRDKRAISSELEVFGLLAAAQGHAERAARLLGVAESLRETIGTPMSPASRAQYDYDRHVAIVRAALGQEAFGTTWAQGRAMTLEQAIAYAMNDDASRKGGSSGQ